MDRLRISVVTPSLNSGDTLARAIESVLAQDYEPFEHIVIDGGSTDSTLDVLKHYQHVKWISEPDRGQSDAMNKGFRLSTGDIIVMLNCDDYFAEGAFKAVIPAFEQGAKLVVGDVEVRSYRLGKSFRNTPRTDFESILRHWETDAYCYNPVGYFYTREVQQACPFNIDNASTMDLEFLLCAAAKFPLTKIDRLLGYYDEGASSQTTRSQLNKGYWNTDTFFYIDKYIDMLPADRRSGFLRDRHIGYEKAEQFWQRQNKIIKIREGLLRLRRRLGLT